MLLSMTGFGRASNKSGDKTISVEIRSLNSKLTDIRFKLPQAYKEKEHILRKLIAEKAERGKIDVNIDIKSLEGDGEYALNQALFTKYYRELHQLSKELDMPPADIMQAILRIPNVVTSAQDTIDEQEWQTLLDTIDLALENFTAFRLEEGAAMEKDCRERIDSILNLVSELEPLEQERVN